MHHRVCLFGFALLVVIQPAAALCVQTYSSSAIPTPSLATTVAVPSANSFPVPVQDPALPRVDTTSPDPFQGNVYQDSITRDYAVTLFNGLLSDPSGNASVRFVVFGGIDDARRQSISEDTAVLHHMLTKALPQHNRTALGVNVHSQREPHAWYIEDRGLVLFYAAGRPVAPSSHDQAEAREEPREQTAWEQAKQEMQGQNARMTFQGVVSRYAANYGANGVNMYPSPAGGMEYEANFAAELDKVVTSALQQVGNFRDLESKDSVTVFVYGPSPQPETGGRSVYAWRVQLADAQDGQPISDKAIERRQYLERGVQQPAPSPLLPTTTPTAR